MATQKSIKKFKMPELRKQKDFTYKVVQFCNGSRLSREISDVLETWTFVNASLSNLTYQINFEKSTGVTIDSKNDCYSFETKSFETTVFEVKKEPNANFVFTIENTSEEPLEIQSQFDYITMNTPNLLNLVNNSRLKLKGVPFDAIPADQLKTILKKQGLTNFIDPDFPPFYESLYDPAQSQNYPFKNAVHFKRPKEWLTGDVQVFLGGIDCNDI